MTPRDPFGGLQQLGAALAEVGDALAAADLERLLAAEAVLGAALDRVPHRLTDESPAAAVIDQARAELLRTRRLGQSLMAFVRASMEAQGVQTAYSRSGAVAPDVRGAAVVARG